MRKFLLLLLVMGLTVPVFAKDWEYKQAGFKFWLPDKWTTQNMDGGILFASDPKKEISVFFMVSPAEGLEEAGNAIEKELDAFLKDIKTEDPQNLKVNGLEVIYVSGKGKTKDGDADVEFAVAFYVKPGDKKVLMLFGMIPSALYDAHEKNIQKIINSVKKK